MHTRNGPAAAWPVIGLFAERQHGAVARRQLLAAGLSAGVIGRLVRGAGLHPVHRGVYAVGHPALMREGRWMAAVLACGEGAALSHRAAAALHGLRSAWNSFLEVSAPRSVRSVRGVIVHRPRSVEMTEVNAIPVTTVARTLVDVADVVEPRVLRKVLEQAEVLRLDATPVPIPGRHGHGRLLAALADLGSVAFTRSELEDRFLELCRMADLPGPSVNVVVEGMEVDFCWREHRVIVETDGWAAHGTRTAFGRDRRRSATLQAAGWTVVRFTYEDVVRDSAYVVATLRRLLGRSVYA